MDKWMDYGSATQRPPAGANLRGGGLFNLYQVVLTPLKLVWTEMTIETYATTIVCGIDSCGCLPRSKGAAWARFLGGWPYMPTKVLAGVEPLFPVLELVRHSTGDNNN